jgi:hypothetical protein
VPMIPVELLATLALSAWATAWLVLALRARAVRRDERVAESRVARWARGGAILLMLAGVSGGIGAWWGLRILDVSGLAVVARPETMRVAPGTDADAMGGVTTGDVVRVVESRSAWQRVLHADGRRGWLPSPRLIAIQPSPR